VIAFSPQIIKLKPANFAMIQFCTQQPKEKAKGIVIHSIDVIARSAAEQDFSVAFRTPCRQSEKRGMWQREPKSARRTLVGRIVAALFPPRTLSAPHLPAALGTFGHLFYSVNPKEIVF